MKVKLAIWMPIADRFGDGVSFGAIAQAQDFKVCKSKFALCKIAPCARSLETKTGLMSLHS